MGCCFVLEFVFGRLGSDIVSRLPCCKAQNSHFLQPLPKSASAAAGLSPSARSVVPPARFVPGMASLDSASFSSSCFGRLGSGHRFEAPLL